MDTGDVCFRYIAHRSEVDEGRKSGGQFHLFVPI